MNVGDTGGRSARDTSRLGGAPSMSGRQPITVDYATHDGVALLADLYRPGGADPAPVVVAVTGGGFRVGSRRGLRDWGNYLAARGIALCAVDHRKTDHGKMFPQAVQDVVAAIRYVAGEAPALGLDPARMAVMGSSAGAHLVAMAALAGDRPPFAGTYPNDRHAGLRPALRGMVLAYGVYDMVAQWQHGLPLNQPPGEDRIARFLGCTPYDDPDLYHLASPLRHVRYANRLATFLLWGDADEVVPPSQSLAFLAALQQARFPVRTCTVAGAGHFWFNEDPIDDERGFSSFVAPRVARFLDGLFTAVPPHREG